jgi:hypothetical protein
VPQRICARLRKLTRLTLLSAGVILALSGTALAQTASGTLRGKVADPQGVPVPTVTVTEAPDAGDPHRHHGRAATTPSRT